jgi:hypothetical protein
MLKPSLQACKASSHIFQREPERCRSKKPKAVPRRTGEWVSFPIRFPLWEFDLSYFIGKSSTLDGTSRVSFIIKKSAETKTFKSPEGEYQLKENSAAFGGHLALYKIAKYRRDSRFDNNPWILN